MFGVPGARISTNIAAFAVSEKTVHGMRGEGSAGLRTGAHDANNGSFAVWQAREVRPER
jgi:hypothetical protein